MSIHRAREVTHKDRIDRTNHPTELALAVATAALPESTIDNSRIWVRIRYSLDLSMERSISTKLRHKNPTMWSQEFRLGQAQVPLYLVVAVPPLNTPRIFFPFFLKVMTIRMVFNSTNPPNKPKTRAIDAYFLPDHFQPTKNKNYVPLISQKQ